MILVAGLTTTPCGLFSERLATSKKPAIFPFWMKWFLFDNDEKLAKTLFDHLTISFDHVVNNLGPHGLPLIGPCRLERLPEPELFL